MIKLILKYKAISILILLIFCSFLYSYYETHQESQASISLELEKVDALTQKDSKENIATQSNPINLQTIKEVPIYICGSVQKPGVYYAREDALIQEIVHLAGGFSNEADPNAVNLAKIINPHEKIYIPKIGDQIDKYTNSYENEYRLAPNQRQININLATLQELDDLPGIGEAKANQIIRYRQQNNGFKSIEELLNVSGIGKATYKELEDIISVD